MLLLANHPYNNDSQSLSQLEANHRGQHRSSRGYSVP